jgi:SAM-dependent methyltransferase
LGVFEALPEFYGTVAQKCGVPPAMMLRLLRALAELRLVERFEAGWRSTEKGAFLGRNHPMTLADAALEYAGPLGDAWRDLDVALRNERTSAGESVFQVVAEDTDRLGPHHRMLQSYAAHDYPAVVAALDIHAGDRVLDAGGGTGTLARLLTRRHVDASVAVLDLPGVVAAAREAGPDDGIKWFAGDLLSPWPTAADVVVLARVLHDWDDLHALAILRNARASLPVGGRVHIVEMLLDPEAPDGGLCDLHLLAVTGGRERTLEDLIALLVDSGFTFERVRRVGALPAIVTGVAR